MDITTLTEDEAMTLLVKIHQHFGWAGTTFTRGDVEQEWQEQMALTPGEEVDEMPDEAWVAIQQSWYWRKGMSEILTERGWDLVHNAVDEYLNG